MRWAQHLARLGRGDVYTGFWWGHLRERDHLEVPGIDWRLIFRRIFKEVRGRARNELMWLGIGTDGGHL